MRRSLALALCLAFVLGAALPQLAAISYAAESEGELVAYSILDDLAIEAKTARTRSGYAQIVGGALVGIVVGVVLHPIVPDYALGLGLAAGALVALPGVITLSRPTAPELALTRVLTFPGSSENRVGWVTEPRTSSKTSVTRAWTRHLSGRAWNPRP